MCLALLMLINGITGCGRHREPKEGETALYYINAEGTDLVKEAYKITGVIPGTYPDTVCSEIS